MKQEQRERWLKEDKAAYRQRLKEHRRKQRRKLTVSKLLRRQIEEQDRKHPERLLYGQWD